MAVASPPPMHNDAMPRLPPRCFNACASVTIKRLPVEPIGWPCAQAPPKMLTRSSGSAEFAHRDHGHHRERFVDFE